MQAERECRRILTHFTRHTSHQKKKECFEELTQIVFDSREANNIANQIRDLQAAVVDTGVCGKTWSHASDQVAYKCITCAVDATCIVCAECFFNANHTGHDFRMVQSPNGCCDCGDAQAWNPKGFCSKHRGERPDTQSLTLIPPQIRERGSGMLQKLFECIDALLHSPADDQLEAISSLIEWVCACVIDSWCLRVLVSYAILLPQSQFTPPVDFLTRLLEHESHVGELPHLLEPLLYKLIVSSDFKFALLRRSIVQVPFAIRLDSDTHFSLWTFGVQLLTVPEFTEEIGRPGGHLQALVHQATLCLERMSVMVVHGSQGPHDPYGTVRHHLLDLVSHPGREATPVPYVVV
eukprot:c12563_g1_i3.p1 GENE.c12563_g1_i3~~c12563_g1_i3.p1  ORF type:complete len:374 (+),score=88.97 c12563_g1_i3:75-1124(+)